MLTTASQQLLIRQFSRRLYQFGLPLLLFTSLLDHAGAFGYRGDDWQRFDRKTVHVNRIIDDQSFDCGTATVRLLGVIANTERTTSYSESSLQGRDVVLRLDTPQTRDAQGELLAYVYLSPTDCWNVDLVRYGAGSVDRQSHCSMIPALLAAESARTKPSHRAPSKSHY